jgi:hypothetical protein
VRKSQNCAPITRENTKLAHIRLLEQVVARPWRYPEGRFAGRGIVSCVSAKPGHSSGKDLSHGYFPGAWVMVNELRRLGCTLPVTFCHLGPLEWDPQLTRLVAPLGVTVIDLRDRERQDPMRILAGWETKVFALQHAPYEEVLFLDADNVPVRDPAYLFDDPRYRERGAVFWPDLPPYDRDEWLPHVVWHNVGMEYHDTVDFESGQLLVNKRMCWAELAACRHINEHSDWYYKFIFGDKSTFHLAWKKCGTDWAMPDTPAGWNGRAILQHDLDGGLLFEHACQNKPGLGGYPDPGFLTNPGECDDHLTALRKAWGGRLWTNDAPDAVEGEVIDRLVGCLFEYRRLGLDARQLRLLEDARVGRGAARCEFGWSVMSDAAGPVLSLTDLDGKPTALLRESGDGVWRGRWLEHERCEVELAPVPGHGRRVETAVPRPAVRVAALA